MKWGHWHRKYPEDVLGEASIWRVRCERKCIQKVGEAEAIGQGICYRCNGRPVRHSPFKFSSECFRIRLLVPSDSLSISDCLSLSPSLYLPSEESSSTGLISSSTSFHDQVSFSIFPSNLFFYLISIHPSSSFPSNFVLFSGFSAFSQIWQRFKSKSSIRRKRRKKKPIDLPFITRSKS